VDLGVVQLTSITAEEITMPTTLTAPEPFPPSAFPAAIARDVSLIYERFPNIGQKIRQTWGTGELHRYLGTLIFDERGGRQGFPETVASALFRVYETDKKVVPEAGKGDIWDVVLNRLE
jgi:hypothetical protein